MKRIFFFLLLTIPLGIMSILIQSCQKDISDNNDNYVKDDKFVAIDEATEIANNVNKSFIVLNSVDKSSLKSTKYQGNKSIRHSLTIPDNNKLPYFYVFNYNSGGFSIISADRRLMPVMVYVDSGEFDLNSLPDGLKNLLETNAQRVKNLRQTNAKQPSFVVHEWYALLCPPEALKATGSTCSTPSTPVTHTGRVLKPPGARAAEYNTLCPTVSNLKCGHALTGCTTVAMAQVMAYWKYPAKYNWSAMPNGYSNIEIARLMGDIFPTVIGKNDYDGAWFRLYK